MKSLRIQNLKSIKDSGNIDIKPLTILIGRNSSGKSSFVRSLPLLKQSAMKKLSSPILWYGEYVDFGSFRNSLNDSCDADKDYIVFSLTYDLKEGKHFSRYGIYTNPRINKITLELHISEGNINKYVFVLDKRHKFSLEFNKDNGKYDLFINGSDDVKGNYNVLNNSFAFFWISENDETIYYYFDYNVIPDELFKKYSISNENEIQARRIVSRLNNEIIFDDKLRMEETKKLLDQVFNKSEKKDEIFDNYLNIICNNLLKFKVTSIVNFIGEYFSSSFDTIQYFQPIRSRGDRYYRVQGLDISKVDSDGTNAPMILYSMEQKERKAFEIWCLDNFGFKYIVDKYDQKGDSASILVKTKDEEKEHNLTDVGFGYSQVLPIILSIWKNQNEKRGIYKKQLIIIEQPELHLHPAFQKKIMSIIIKLITNREYDIRFLIETHSETIINFIGRCVRDELIKNDDINLIIVEKEQKDSSFKSIKYSKDGYIENWPSGFFSGD